MKKFGVFALLVVLAVLLLPCICAGAQFVELTAEIEGEDWDYWFFADRLGKYGSQPGIPSIFTPSQRRRCVIGAGKWMIESEFPNQKVTRWFTGTNIIEHTLVTKDTPEADAQRLSERSRIAMSPAKAGHRSTRVHPTEDGNPGRPVRVADLMGFDFAGTVSWLAFCSGSALQREGRLIYPPSAFWKQSSIIYWGWTDATEVFKDDLGLPKRINLISTNGQPIFQYQVRQSTNVLGWNFPLEFYGVQYLPAETNTWKVHLTLKGRVTSIRPATFPKIPEEVVKEIRK